MSFGYGINRLLDLQETNFQVFDMDVKEDKITYTIRHKKSRTVHLQILRTPT
jgi:hypothetical protein